MTAAHPARFGELPTAIERTPAHPHPDLMTVQTIQQMARYAREAVFALPVQETVWQMLGRTPRRSHQEIAQAVFWFLKRRVRFVPDAHLLREAGIEEEELLIRPERLLTMPEPAGDCDDFSMATAALLHLAGVPVEFVTVAADRAEPGRFSHVYVQAVLEDGSRLALDASHGEYPGWETRNAYRRQVWDAAGNPVEAGN